MEEHERLLLLIADKLDVVHATMRPERFNFTKWVGLNWAGLPDLSCGTSACALGWASTIPELRALGLRLFKGDAAFGYIAVIRPDLTVSADCGDVGSIFGLTDEEFEFLFIPSSDQSVFALDEQEETYGHHAPDPEATAKQVADHIRDFVQFKYH